ncbi:MAG: transcriptional regulator [Azospirillum sp.]|nr:transcriptional regulator [Azospirillum sp.]
MPFLNPKDHLEHELDLRALLVRRPAATFYLRARGDALAALRIHDGDLLVVDRSVEPTDGAIVVATADGGFVIRQLRHTGGGWLLACPGSAKPAVAVDAEAGVQVWGVVTASITEHWRQ